MDHSKAKNKILDAVFILFRKNGMKFTMDDLAAAVGMSKKTLYQLFHDKEDLLCQMVDYCFHSIKQRELEILHDDSLNTPEKIRRILGAMPDRYYDLDFRQLYILKDKFPKAYARIEQRLENDWEATISLLHRGMEEGTIRSFSIPIFKMMFEASLEQFFQKNVLIEQEISYTDGLNEVVNLLIDGIFLPPAQEKHQ